MDIHDLGSSVSCTTVSLLKPNNPHNVGEHKLTINHVRRRTVYKRLWRLLFHLVVRGALPAFGRGNETTWLRSHILTVAPCVKAKLYGVWMLGSWDFPEPTETIAEWSSQPGMSNLPQWRPFPFWPAFRWPTWIVWVGVESFTTVLRGSLWSPFSLIFFFFPLKPLRNSCFMAGENHERKQLSKVLSQHEGETTLIFISYSGY